MNRKEKLNVLRHLAMAIGDPAVAPVLAFMAGRLDSIFFVRDLEGAGVSVQFSVTSLIWPRTPFRARIGDEAVGHPLVFIERMALRDDEIYVRVEFATAEPPEWYLPVLEDGVMGRRSALEHSIEQIRRKIDMALDAYRTASEAFEDAPVEEQQYLRFVLERAKADMRTLNSQLGDLELKLGKVKQ